MEHTQAPISLCDIRSMLKVIEINIHSWLDVLLEGIERGYESNMKESSSPFLS
jgi:hypothetical protein